MSKTTLRKGRSGLEITIPAQLVQELRLKVGQRIEVARENDRLVLTPVSPEMEMVSNAHKKVLRKYWTAFRCLSGV